MQNATASCKVKTAEIRQIRSPSTPSPEQHVYQEYEATNSAKWREQHTKTLLIEKELW